MKGPARPSWTVHEPLGYQLHHTFTLEDAAIGKPALICSVQAPCILSKTFALCYRRRSSTSAPDWFARDTQQRAQLGG
jgi:hypothetical protein